MSRDIAPFGLRMPAELKRTIENAAKDNGRSMNAEIIHRLELSFVETINRQPGELSADMARQIAKNARENLLSTAKDYVQQEIARTVCIGLNELVIDIKAIVGITEDHDLDEKHDQPLFQELISPLIKYLEELGFEVEFDLELMRVRF